MIALLWNLSVAIRGYLRFYMPTNRALDWLRTPQGVTWTLPAVVVLTPAYLYSMSLAAVLGARPGLGSLNVLVVIFGWNAMKFAWVGVLAPLHGLRVVVAQWAQRLLYGPLRDCDLAPLGGMESSAPQRLSWRRRP